jgi:hypothetical protein
VGGAAPATATADAAASGAEDPFAANYGDAPVEETQSKAVTGRSWTEVRDLGAAAGHSVLVRGFAQQEIRSLGRMAFAVLREGRSSVQCVLAAGVCAQMVAFAKSLTRESVVDVEGVVCFPKEPAPRVHHPAGSSCCLLRSFRVWIHSCMIRQTNFAGLRLPLI